MRRTPAECQYQVVMFAVLTQASFPSPPVVSSPPLQEQTDRAWGLCLPSWDLRLSSEEKNIACVDFFGSISLFAALLLHNPPDYSRKWLCTLEYNPTVFYFYIFFLEASNY